MGIRSIEVKQKLEILRSTFIEEDYIKYRDGNITFNFLMEKYQCSKHVIDIYFKEKGYIKRQQLKSKSIKEDIFDVINSSEKAYILGFYIADGYITGPTFGIAIK